MALIVLVVPVLTGAFLLLMEWFEARLLGVALSADVDSDPVRPVQPPRCRVVLTSVASSGCGIILNA